LAYLREPLVHREREGIACLRTVECGAPNAVPHVEQEVIGARGLLIHAIRLRGSYSCGEQFECKDPVSASQGRALQHVIPPFEFKIVRRTRTPCCMKRSCEDCGSKITAGGRHPSAGT